MSFGPQGHPLVVVVGILHRQMNCTGVQNMADGCHMLNSIPRIANTSTGAAGHVDMHFLHRFLLGRVATPAVTH